MQYFPPEKQHFLAEKQHFLAERQDFFENRKIGKFIPKYVLKIEKCTVALLISINDEEMMKVLVMVDDDLSLEAKIIVSTAIEHYFADGLFGGRQLW